MRSRWKRSQRHRQQSRSRKRKHQRLHHPMLYLRHQRPYPLQNQFSKRHHCHQSKKLMNPSCTFPRHHDSRHGAQHLSPRSHSPHFHYRP
ncbi:uncharacterized protein B0I36DRAFT_332174 [Microdochium trichocladiopsis]|uniref:Uncharacterized protein n=1 Tax=Microdochium trichocladiopsis TaxID=1682393 RepID=A0A9P8XYI0_9PEZI|nr:uncharacterized protein B0I36DRAFT_332174 [Microdochium trichocladiopsis]KAH7024890.1 hypothetical protein B0I36DRAFT_332174 [Microdochium trichocladiopsis]